MIDSYTALQTAVENWLDRDDDTVVDRIPEFIQLAESKIRRRVRKKTIRTNLVVGGRATTLPSDCAELRSAKPTTSTTSLDRPLILTTPENLAKRAAGMSTSGRPRYFAVVDGQLLLAPTPDDDYTLEVIYYEALTPLSSTVSTNSVLRDNPDIYLYGALAEAEPYIKNDERVALWKGNFNEAVEELNELRQKEEYGASLRSPGLPVVFG